MKFNLVAIAAFMLTASSAHAAGNIAYIDQTDNNTATTTQTCIGDSCDNVAGIIQVYQDYNGAPGAANNAVLTQHTTHNEGYITQQGNNNQASMAQRNNAYADIRQIDAYDSVATINQNQDPVDLVFAGENNVAGILQEGIAHDALIKQFGDNGEAYITQLGDANIGKVIQNAGSDREYVDIVQDGWGNIADVVMNGKNDDAWLGQTGMKNNIDLDVAATSRDSTVKTYQQGSFNGAKLYNQGEGNMILIDQNDTRNALEASQLGNGQTAEFTQDGIDNTAFIGQYENATDTTAAIRQFGNNHEAAIYQSSANSTAYITQRGVGGSATIHQP